MAARFPCSELATRLALAALIASSPLTAAAPTAEQVGRCFDLIKEKPKSEADALFRQCTDELKSPEEREADVKIDAERAKAEAQAAATAKAKQEQEKRAMAAKTEQQAKILADLTARLATSEQSAQFLCHDKSQCEKAFILTQVYVSEHSDMKIQLATTAVIETYNPIEIGKVGIKATLMPQKGPGATILLVAACRSNDSFLTRKQCLEERIAVQENFVPFLKSSM